VGRTGKDGSLTLGLKAPIHGSRGVLHHHAHLQARRHQRVTGVNHGGRPQHLTHTTHSATIARRNLPAPRCAPKAAPNCSSVKSPIEATAPGVAERGTLLGVAVDLSDGVIDIDERDLVAAREQPRYLRCQPGQQPRGHRVELQRRSARSSPRPRPPTSTPPGTRPARSSPPGSPSSDR